ncbi:hypothetical protein A2300_02580 [Candidatus Falkowbacteria bacterium RIFOXYB2_FULL_35_7]|nr:MAG: hypothetical protein A2300_02580 [Candidatus Falkowbacteria bacterium RIFOXYB2_FULL_35_7]
MKRVENFEDFLNLPAGTVVEIRRLKNIKGSIFGFSLTPGPFVLRGVICPTPRPVESDLLSMANDIYPSEDKTKMVVSCQDQEGARYNFNIFLEDLELYLIETFEVVDIQKMLEVFIGYSHYLKMMNGESES